MTDPSPFAPTFGHLTEREAPPATPEKPPAAMARRVREHNAQWEARNGVVDLRAWRVRHGLSQFQAAVKLGVSLSCFIRWETKAVPELRRAWLAEVCK